MGWWQYRIGRKLRHLDGSRLTDRIYRASKFQFLRCLLLVGAVMLGVWLLSTGMDREKAIRLFVYLTVFIFFYVGYEGIVLWRYWLEVKDNRVTFRWVLRTRCYAMEDFESLKWNGERILIKLKGRSAYRPVAISSWLDDVEQFIATCEARGVVVERQGLLG